MGQWSKIDNFKKTEFSYNLFDLGFECLCKICKKCWWFQKKERFFIYWSKSVWKTKCQTTIIAFDFFCQSRLGNLHKLCPKCKCWLNRKTTKHQGKTRKHQRKIKVTFPKTSMIFNLFYFARAYLHFEMFSGTVQLQKVCEKSMEIRIINSSLRNQLNW